MTGSSFLDAVFFLNIKSITIWVVIASLVVSFAAHSVFILRIALFVFLLMYFGHLFYFIEAIIHGYFPEIKPIFFLTYLGYPISELLMPIFGYRLDFARAVLPRFPAYVALGSYLLALYIVGPEVRRYEWWRLRTLLTRGPGALRQRSVESAAPLRSAARSASSPMSAVEGDDEEREIALARRRVEQAEELHQEAPGFSASPAQALDEGPSWWQRQRERREVERAQREMEQAEREAAQRDAPLPHPAYAGHPYPYPAYAPPKRPLSEWFKSAYWGTRILILVVVAVWMVFASSSLLGALFALVPKPLLDLGAEFVIKLGEAMKGS